MSTLYITYGNTKIATECQNGTILMEALRKAGAAPAAPCGGMGTCGKCVVIISDGQGTRRVLACRYRVAGDCYVTVPFDKGDISWNETLGAAEFGKVLSDAEFGKVLSDAEYYGASVPGREGLGLAVDLGTTTIAAKLYDLRSGKLLGTRSEWNAQRPYGADVITRIKYTIDNGGGLELLSEEVRRQIRKMAGLLCMKKSREPADIKEIFICGNTVMEHIFAGISPDCIASVPYEPRCFFDGGGAVSGESALRLTSFPAATFLAPCVAGYVGGDIVCGLLGSGLYRKPGKNLFIDIGTNGEMALGGSDGFVCCAVACGPAFEGAGIACGMQAADGAISKAWIEEGLLKFQVVGGSTPKGICGSGLLDLIACLLELGAIKRNGRLDGASPMVSGKGADARVNLTDDGSVFLCQKDIRQLQLAKAAVAAGIKVLLEEEGLKVEELDGLYLAGGFGNRLNPLSAAKIGMLPMELIQPEVGSVPKAQPAGGSEAQVRSAGGSEAQVKPAYSTESKVHPLGNSALSGAEDALINPILRKTLIEIKNSCRYVELSTSSSFSEEYIKQLNF